MKKILLILFAVLLLAPGAYSDESMLDFDMDFVDNPFKNQKPVSDQQFRQALEQKTARRKGVIEKFRDFLNRNKPENDPALKNFKSDGPGELGMKLRDIENLKPSVIVSAPLVDNYGRTIPAGHYQISISNKNNIKLINFIQGSGIYGTLKAHPAHDDWEANSIIYARILYLDGANVARVIFSNIDECVEGYAVLKKP